MIKPMFYRAARRALLLAALLSGVPVYAQDSVKQRLALSASAITRILQEPGGRGLTSRIQLTRPELGNVRISLRNFKTHQIRASYHEGDTAHSGGGQLELGTIDVLARRVIGQTSLTSSGAVYISQVDQSSPTLHLAFSLTTRKRLRPIQRDYEVIARLSPQQGTLRSLRVRRIPVFPNTSDRRGYCQLTNPAIPTASGASSSSLVSSPSALPDSRALTISTPRFVSLSIVADSRFYKVYKADTASVIALILSEADRIYRQQLGMSLRLQSLNIYTRAGSDPFASAKLNFQQLLESFSRFVNDGRVPAADLFQLFTSARGYTQAIGLAYVGTACTFPDFSTGWTDYASGLMRFIQTFSHELGHSLGADHDFVDSRSIMSGTGEAQPVNPYFSQASRSEVLSFALQSGSCLIGDEGTTVENPGITSPAAPNEDDSNIRLSIRRSYRSANTASLGGLLSSVLTGRLSGRIIELRKGNGTLLSTALTTRAGAYSFILRRKGRYFVVDRMSGKSSSLARY